MSRVGAMLGQGDYAALPDCEEMADFHPRPARCVYDLGEEDKTGPCSDNYRDPKLSQSDARAVLRQDDKPLSEAQSVLATPSQKRFLALEGEHLTSREISTALAPILQATPRQHKV